MLLIGRVLVLIFHSPIYTLVFFASRHLSRGRKTLLIQGGEARVRTFTSVWRHADSMLTLSQIPPLVVLNLAELSYNSECIHVCDKFRCSRWQMCQPHNVQKLSFKFALGIYFFYLYITVPYLYLKFTLYPTLLSS